MADSSHSSDDLIRLEAELERELSELKEGNRMLEAETIKLKDEIDRLQAEIAYTRSNLCKTIHETERDLITGKLSASQIDFIQRETDRLQLSVEWNEPELDQKIERLQRLLNQVKPPKAQ